MGGRKCCINGCYSSSARIEDRGVTYHRFPVNVEIRKGWLAKSKMSPGARLTKGTFVCSRHFRKADFQNFKGTKYLLKQGSIPSIFPWDEGGQWVAPGPSDATTKSNTTETQMDTSEGVTTKPTESITEVKKAEGKSPNKRSASAEEFIPSPQKKIARKTSDSAIIKETSTANITTPTTVQVSPITVPVITPIMIPKPILNFVPGTKIEAQDFDKSWFTARVVEVDQDDREVLIHFEKNNKGIAANIPDEWISMDSSRLRAVQQHRKAPISFAVGEKCLARWSDARKFPGTVQKVLENDYYEVLFDDGYMKVVRANHMGKIRRATNPGPNTTPPGGSPKPLPAGFQPPVLPQLPRPEPVVIDWDKIPEQPEGEWSCHWFNDEPVGQEATIYYADGRPVKTTIVKDNRLPTGWIKHLFQRTGFLAKWDVMLESPTNKIYRNKNELKAHLEELGQKYTPDIYDFCLHKRRAKELGLSRYDPDYFNASHIRLEKKLTAAEKKIIQEQEAAAAVEAAAKANDDGITNSETQNKDFVMLGSIKVQILDNLFRCPKEGCMKNFRKENHCQIHIKHYHKEMADLLGVCPNMQDLAYLRTVGVPMDEPLPKNHLPNNQFFERVHQNEIQSKTHRKSTGGSSSAETSLIDPNAVDIKIEDVSGQETVPQTSKPAKKLTLLEEALNSRPPVTPVDSSYFLSKENIQAVVAPASHDKTPATQPSLDPEPMIKSHALPKSSGGGATSRPKPKIKFGKYPRKDSKKKSKKFFKARPRAEEESLSVFNDETRHSFDNPSDTAHNLAFKRQKFLSQNFSMDSLNDTNSSMADPTSQSPKYIQEDGEVIKIVRMRQEEIINCICSFPEEDGLMIQCELCLCWQHGICNGIERESSVPEKYVCFICRNPHRGRPSLKYIHDQEWLYEGRLPTINPNESFKREKRYNLLKQSHTLTGNLLELKQFLHSLTIKMSIAEKKEHPKMYLWSKKWESSPPPTATATRPEDFGIEPLTSSTDIKVDTKIEKNPELGLQILQPTPSQEAASKDEKLSEEMKEKIKEENAELLSGLLQTPGGTNIDLIKMTTDEKPKVDAGDAVEIKTPPPNVPMPEAPIDSAECQARLLEHIQKQQVIAMSRLQAIEDQIAGLESFDETADKLENNDFIRTKQTIQMLIKDLITMRKIATANASEVYGTFI